MRLLTQLWYWTWMEFVLTITSLVENIPAENCSLWITPSYHGCFWKDSLLMIFEHHKWNSVHCIRVVAKCPFFELHKRQDVKLLWSLQQTEMWEVKQKWLKYFSSIAVCLLDLFISDLKRQEPLHTINVHWCLWRPPDFYWCFIVFIFLPEQMQPFVCLAKTCAYSFSSDASDCKPLRENKKHSSKN